MTDVWSQRAEAFRESPTHKEGPDLDLLVEWCEPGAGVKVLDVATGGGHVARRLREEGCTVVTVDPAPGMRPDVVAPAEDLPVRCHSEEEWKKMLTDAGLDVEQVERFERHPVFEDWLTRVGTPPDDARHVRELLGDRIDNGLLTLKSIVVKARRSQT